MISTAASFVDLLIIRLFSGLKDFGMLLFSIGGGLLYRCWEIVLAIGPWVSTLMYSNGLVHVVFDGNNRNFVPLPKINFRFPCLMHCIGRKTTLSRTTAPC